MLEMRTFIFVFLKALQVIGNIQEVLVRSGDTIVLNCTCISQTNGNWVGPNRALSKTDRMNETQLIPYTEGFRLNTKLNIPNINVVGSYESRTCNMMIKSFSFDDEGTYKCQYVDNHKTHDQVYKALLKRPPTNLKIANATQNNTLQVVEGCMLQLVCSVQSGKPKEMLQWITNTTVIKEGNQNGTITYRLNASSSDHMKIFICSAFNDALDHPIKKLVQLDVLGKPKVTVSIIPDSMLLREHQNAELCCKTGGNPKATYITWIKDTQRIKRLNDSKYCIPFTPLRRQDSGIYTCTAKNSIGFSSATKQIRVLYPPDVSIDTTESPSKIILKCRASSDPGTYEFAKWEHLSEFDKHIRYIRNTQNGTLVLEKNNYQNSGIYKCRVKNGVPDMNGEIYQKELVVIDYKGPPVFVSNNSNTWFAQYPEDAKIILKVFSSSKITSGRIRTIEKGDKEEEKQAFKSITPFIQSLCRESMAFYNVNVLVECIELTFQLAIPASDDLRNYTVEVCNTFNCSSLEFTVVSAKFIEIRHSSGWIISATMVMLAVISCALVFAIVKVRGRRKRSRDIRTSDIEMDIHGESVDNRLYLSTESRPSHSTRHQTELNDENIPTTGLNQSISALNNQYQEEISEEQNVLDDNRIIPTQHAKSNLNYAEVEFEAGPTSSTSIIHGHEDRTIYSEIDLLRLTNAIPSSSDSDEDDFVCVDGIENYNKKD